MKTCPLCDRSYPDSQARCPQDGALLLESLDFAPGQIIRGKYKIIAKIGQGGMGTVYLAEDTFLSAKMALKFLSFELSSDPSFTRRFRDEARTAFRLRHPNVVEVNGLDQSESGSLFIAMEYVDGPSLRDLIHNARGPLPVPRAMMLARGIAAGLEAAHAAGFVHRDIKPENVVVRRSDGIEQPKILDFGIVAVMEKVQADEGPIQRLSRGPILTAEYAAPEQWGFSKPEDLDGRTDTYALGGVLYEMLTGRLPFRANTYEGWMAQHLKAEPLPPSSYNPEILRHEGIDDFVLWLLKKRREDRPANDAELLRALDAIAKPARPLATQSFSEQPVWQPTVMDQRVRPGTERPMQNSPAPAPVASHPRRGVLWIATGAMVAVLVMSALGAVALRARNGTGNVADPEVKRSAAVVAPNAPVPDSPHAVAPVPTPVVRKTDVPISDKLPRAVLEEKVSQPKPDGHLSETPAELDKQGTTFFQSNEYSQAAATFNEACALGSVRSCARLAEMTAKGEGVPKDPQRVVELRKKACDGGDMAECYHLSFNYQAGEGVAVDKAKTESLRGHACNGGIGEACESLGAMYLTDPEFKSEQKAATYFQLGCDLNSKESCWYMGKLLDLGKGVPRDAAKAKALYAKSCTLGYQKSCGAGQSQ